MVLALWFYWGWSGVPCGAEEVVGPAAPTEGEEAGQGSPDAVGETGGKGVAKEYACNMEGEEDVSVIGAGVFARRVADIGRPGDNGGALAARGFAVAAGQEGAEGHIDFWEAVGLPGK